MKIKSLTFIMSVGLLLITAFFVLFLNFQYRQYKNPISCGGDWNYNIQCPVGTRCKSIGEGKLAGGLCQPYLQPVFQSFKSSAGNIPKESKETSPAKNGSESSQNFQPTKDLYTYRKVADIKFSPKGDYAYFVITGYEFAKPFFLDIVKGTNILQGYDIWFGNVYWSPDGTSFAIKSVNNEFSGEGVDGVFINIPGTRGKLRQIFAIQWEEHIKGTYIGDVNFVDDENLSFSVFSRIGPWDPKSERYSDVKKEYLYSFLTGELR